MPIILHSTNLCNPILVTQTLLLQFFFSRRNGFNLRLLFEESYFFVAKFCLAKSSPQASSVFKSELGPNNKAETQLPIRVLLLTATCDPILGVSHRPIVQIPQGQRGVRLRGHLRDPSIVFKQASESPKPWRQTPNYIATTQPRSIHITNLPISSSA